MPVASADNGNVSAYCEQGVTADGSWTYWGEAAAASWVPFGSLVWIQGYGTVVIEDRGQPGLFTFDLAMPGGCQAAREWGRHWDNYYVILRWGW